MKEYLGSGEEDLTGLQRIGFHFVLEVGSLLIFLVLKII
jgi:hypothetical protein